MPINSTIKRLKKLSQRQTIWRGRGDILIDNRSNKHLTPPPLTTVHIIIDGLLIESNSLRQQIQ